MVTYEFNMQSRETGGRTWGRYGSSSTFSSDCKKYVPDSKSWTLSFVVVTDYSGKERETKVDDFRKVNDGN